MAKFKETFVDKVNERSKGEVTIKLLGGGEVIEPVDQGFAVQMGVVDMALTLVGYYESLVPGAGAINLSQVSHELERERDFYGLMN